MQEFPPDATQWSVQSMAETTGVSRTTIHCIHEQIDTVTPPELILHLIIDNYATHKHPKVVKWLKRHPWFHVHFVHCIPTSSSRLIVERWSRDFTQKRICNGVFRGVA